MSRKKFVHKINEQAQAKDIKDYSYESQLKQGILIKKEKVKEPSRTGFVSDQDVLSLLKLKEELYPIYNY